jgi:hypothetical protein
MVGDRGLLTSARINETLRPAGLDWITALRAPAIKALAAEGGPLQPSLFDTRDPRLRAKGFSFLVALSFQAGDRDGWRKTAPCRGGR